jgi:3-hydroxy-3-methylglutaryl CoA synthase
VKRVGIEKINAYGSSLYLDQQELAVARGRDPEKVVADFMIHRRSLNPPYEDTITMGANAAKPMLTEADKESIGLLIVGTEGSLDFGKPISTNIHGALGLPANVRNYETKHACYSGVAALDAAVNWVASGLANGKKALVIATDFSRMHFNMKEEFVLGGVATAALVSDEPRVVEFELSKKGSWTTDAYDTFRPSAKHEVGNNEVSLFTYMDALEGAYNDYLRAVGQPVDFDTYFDFNLYHTPFAGMAFQAHRTLCNLARPRKKAEVKESFGKKVMPGLRQAQEVGSTYGSSNFLGICSVVTGDAAPTGGERIGFFAYGSGAIGEFYSGIVCPGARDAVAAMKIDEALAARRAVTVAEYEAIEKLRESYVEQPEVDADRGMPEGWYDAFYRDKGYLVLRQVQNFARSYEWS